MSSATNVKLGVRGPRSPHPSHNALKRSRAFARSLAWRCHSMASESPTTVKMENSGGNMKLTCDLPCAQVAAANFTIYIYILCHLNIFESHPKMYCISNSFHVTHRFISSASSSGAGPNKNKLRRCRAAAAVREKREPFGAMITVGVHQKGVS